MADPVAQLEALLSVDVDKSSLRKASKEIESLRKSIRGGMTDEAGRSPLAENLKSTTRQYKTTLTQIKKAFGANDRQAKTIINETLGKDKRNLGFKLAQQSDVKGGRAKKWTLRELVSKEEEYQRLRATFSGQGLSGAEVIAKLNKELGPNFVQERGRRRAEIERYNLTKKENKERKQSLALYKKLGYLGKVAGVGSVATIVNKVVSSTLRAGNNKLQSLYKFGGAELATMKKVYGNIGGSFWSNKEIEKATESSFSYIQQKAQNLPSIGADIKSMSIATMGRGSQYIQRYAGLVAEGARTGEPKYREISLLANEIAGSNLSAADKRALMNQMLGSEELTESMLKNAGQRGTKYFEDAINEYYSTSMAGVSQAQNIDNLRVAFNRAEIEAGTAESVQTEINDIRDQAEKTAGEKSGFFSRLFGTEEYQKNYQEAAHKELERRASMDGLSGIDTPLNRKLLGIEGYKPAQQGNLTIQNNIYGEPSQKQLDSASELTERDVNIRNMQGV